MRDTTWNQHGKVGGTLLENWVEERAVGKERVLKERDVQYISKYGHEDILCHDALVKHPRDLKKLEQTRMEAQRQKYKTAKMEKFIREAEEETFVVPTGLLEQNHPTIYETTFTSSYCTDFKPNNPLCIDYETESVEQGVTFWSHMHERGCHTAYSSNGSFHKQTTFTSSNKLL